MYRIQCFWFHIIYSYPKTDVKALKHFLWFKNHFKIAQVNLHTEQLNKKHKNKSTYLNKGRSYEAEINYKMSLAWTCTIVLSCYRWSPHNQSPRTISIGNKWSPRTTGAWITCPPGPPVPATSSPPWTLMVPPLNSSINLKYAYVSCPAPPIFMCATLALPSLI